MSLICGTSPSNFPHGSDPKIFQISSLLHYLFIYLCLGGYSSWPSIEGIFRNLSHFISYFPLILSLVSPILWVVSIDRVIVGFTDSRATNLLAKKQELCVWVLIMSMGKSFIMTRYGSIDATHLTFCTHLKALVNLCKKRWVALIGLHE